MSVSLLVTSAEQWKRSRKEELTPGTFVEGVYVGKAERMIMRFSSLLPTPVLLLLEPERDDLIQFPIWEGLASELRDLDLQPGKVMRISCLDQTSGQLDVYDSPSEYECRPAAGRSADRVGVVKALAADPEEA